MRLLLDTHVFLWYITADPKLPAPFRAASQDPANEVYLSVASVWETVIKHHLGKPSLDKDVAPSCLAPERSGGAKQLTHLRSTECMPCSSGFLTFFHVLVIAACRAPQTCRQNLLQKPSDPIINAS
jgi:hypothetical protein